MHIQLSPQQEAALLEWAARRTDAEVQADCEPSGYELTIAISPIDAEATARKGPDELCLGAVSVQVPVGQASQSAAPKAATFVEMLKRFNAKERNFLMRYALCPGGRPVLSSTFLGNLLQALEAQGIERLEGTRPVYFGMDYHLEWMLAALLLANGANAGKIHDVVEKGRIEDMDLIVVLERTDGSIVLALIEAKGAARFSMKQLTSKLKRLEPIAREVSETSGVITPAVILMSPAEFKPAQKTLQSFADSLQALGWRGEAAQGQTDGLWMELEGFFSDMGGKENALRISECYPDGTSAPDRAAKLDKPYSSWHVVGRL